MKIKEIEDIIRLFEKAAISKMDLEVDNIKITLEKNSNYKVAEQQFVGEEKEIRELPKEEKIGQWVTSPIVGTFYATRAEGVEPFVKVGGTVKKGEIICIVEAMKMMNEIKAPKDGIIMEIKPKNEDMVAYGESLILIGESND